MSEKNYLELKDHGVPIRAWVKGVKFEPEAEKQLRNAAQLPFVFRWIAAMPDVHTGIGATVGSVIPTRGAIIPAAVGVDIGCGMAAVRTSLTRVRPPRQSEAAAKRDRSAVPHGRTDHGRSKDVGAWRTPAGAKPRAMGIRSKAVTTQSPVGIPESLATPIRRPISEPWAPVTTSSKSAWTKATGSG